MKELIHASWRPSTKTINALKAGGWSDEQRKRILIAFIQDERYWNKEIEGASTLYNTWVRFETPRDAKAKPDNAKELIKARAKDLENKSEDGAERAQEAQHQEGIMTKQDAIAWYDSRR